MNVLPNDPFKVYAFAAVLLRRRRLAVSAITLLAAGAATGGSLLPPPTWPVPDIESTGTRTQPITGVKLDKFQVTFERTTFSDVLAALGRSPIRHQGDAGDFLMWVCYTLPDLHARVWFTSSELGGQRFIDGLVAKRLNSTEAGTSRCPVAARPVTSVSTDKGVWLGAALKSVEGVLGTARKASAIYYAYEGKVDGFDVDSILALKIRGDKVTELYASHTTTN